MSQAYERTCWCGENQLTEFSADYWHCTFCGTLVSRMGLDPKSLLVYDDEHDFYGKEYWLSHQREDLANPDIYQRARSDLSERCLHWLKTLLAYQLPPSRVLELGSAHGGFVALMRWAGYDATGLEMSPWVVDFAKQTFDIPMLLGQLEDQHIAAASLDAIVLYDILEHLDNPLGTMRRCTELLKPDGLIIIQTPSYPENTTYVQLVERQDPFLAHIDKKANQHLYLFSQHAAQLFCEQLGMRHVLFEPALFGYDMYFVASKTELIPTAPERLAQVLQESPAQRLIQALIDLDTRVVALKQECESIERDRQARIANITQLNQHIQRTSLDYQSRLNIILEQQAKIGQLGQQIAQLSQQITQLSQQVNQLTQQLHQTTTNYQHQQALGREQQQLITQQQSAFDTINQNIFVRILRFMRLLPKFTQLHQPAIDSNPPDR